MPQGAPERPQPRAPLHLCALTLTPHRNPVASPDGHVFDSATLRQLIRRTGLNPITGWPLSPDSLVPLNISTDPRTSLPRCPILFHSFNQNIKIVAVATSGNVYSFSAVQRLNIQSGNMADLIDRTPFTLDDLIVLFDPQEHVWSTHSCDAPEHPRVPRHPQTHPVTLPSSPLVVSNHPVRRVSSESSSYPISAPERRHPPHPPQPPPPQPLHPPAMALHSLSPLNDTTVPTIQPKVDSLLHQRPYFPTTHSPVNPSEQLHSPTSQPIHSAQLPMRVHPAPGIPPPAYPPTPTLYPSLSSCDHLKAKRTVQKRLEPSPILKRPRMHPAVLPTKIQPPTQPVIERKNSPIGYLERKKAEEERKKVYKRIRKGRKGKGYVRVVTNIGHLNIELHCDKVPMTCDNFLSLAENKYYDGLPWHRVIPGFIAQTGDPSGTGEGGNSYWGGFFKDEIRTSLVHEGAGVVSMANSGRDTNLSQWFICLDAAPHLDGSHTVFGKVVGGLFVLKKIENEAEMGHPLTVEKIEVLVNPIRQVRERMQKQAQSQAISSAENSANATSSQASSVPSNQPTIANLDQTQSGAPISMPMQAHPPLHSQSQPSVPYTISNHLPRTIQENLPPARTLLSAADNPPTDV